MRKILGILGAIGITTTASTSVVACGQKGEPVVITTMKVVVDNWIYENINLKNNQLTLKSDVTVNQLEEYSYMSQYVDPFFESIDHVLENKEIPTFKMYLEKNWQIFWSPQKVFSKEEKQQPIKNFLKTYNQWEIHIGYNKSDSWNEKYVPYGVGNIVISLIFVD